MSINTFFDKIEDKWDDVKDLFHGFFNKSIVIANDVGEFLNAHQDEIINAAITLSTVAQKAMGSAPGNAKMIYVRTVLKDLVIPSLQAAQNKKLSEVAMNATLNYAEAETEKYVQERIANGDWDAQIAKLEKVGKKVEKILGPAIPAQ